VLSGFYTMPAPRREISRESRTTFLRSLYQVMGLLLCVKGLITCVFP
jgi:hypothetical protein